MLPPDPAPTGHSHSCDLDIDGNRLRERYCVIEPDGNKYLVFSGLVGKKNVTIRLREDEWIYNEARDVLELKASPEAAKRYAQLLASA